MILFESCPTGKLNFMQRKVTPKAPSKVPPAGSESGTQMLIEERRQHILSLAQQQGRVLVEELSESLGISRITIRKDLDYLQRRGVLQRTHGGALLPQSGTLFAPSIKEKEGRHLQEKQRIAVAAASLIHE